MDGLALPPSPMQALQAEHERLLGRLDDVGGAPCPGLAPAPVEQLSYDTQALIHEAQDYIERAKVEAEWISDARDRSQLRANLRFWASFLLNCTGAYPDTTLRPARPFMSDFTGPARPPMSGTGLGETVGNPPAMPGGAADREPGELALEEDQDEEADVQAQVESVPVRPSWLSRLSRFFGLFAILIVGAIPLVAVCMALSLFYNLDNQSPWASEGNPATQTAVAMQQLPSPTPIPTTSPWMPLPVIALPRLVAQVALGSASPQGASCEPVLLLSLDAPETAAGVSIPGVQVSVFPAGQAEPVNRVILQPGAAPISVDLGAYTASKNDQDLLIQADHPWLGVEAVILSGEILRDCGKNQVTIVYQSVPGTEVWQQALESTPSQDLSLTWDLLTWGPEPLGKQSWVAALALQGSGGNDSYVYFATGDLAAQTTGTGLLPESRVVLEQALCFPAVAQVGVTSGGLSMRYALAVRLVVPECY